MDDFIEGLKLLLALLGAAAIIFTGLAIWKIAIIAAELFKIDM